MGQMELYTVRLIRSVIIVVFASVLVGCGRNAIDRSSEADSVIDSIEVVELDSLQSEHDLTADAMLWVDSIMAEMTLEELAGQLILPAVYSDDSEVAMRQLRSYASDSHVGGVVLLKGSVQAAKNIADTLLSLSAAPPFIAIDAEWGLAMRLDGTPGFPRNGRISADADETLLFDYGYEVARESREIGINMVLGPVLDVVPAGRRSAGIGSRSFGSDAERVARLGTAYSKGIESAGVMSVAKHFPGHGSADADSHKRLPTISKSLEEIEATDLLPFRRYIDNGLSGIMTGHLFVPALEESEIPVTVSERIQVDLLRKEMGFDGLIITDAMNMAGADGKSGADAIMAGADIVLAPANTAEEVRLLADGVREGRFSLEALRDRVRRVLFHKYMLVGGSQTEYRHDDSKSNLKDILLTNGHEEEINFLRTRLLK